MKLLREKIESDKRLILSSLTPLRLIRARVPFEIEPDHDIVEYQKHVQKEYFFRDEVDISAYCEHAITCDVEDFGYDRDDSGDLIQEFGNERNGSLTLTQGASNLRRKLVVIEGSVRASNIDFQILDEVEAFADLEIVGIRPGEELSIYQELLLEAYELEMEHSHRMAYFTYFTALEAFVTHQLEAYKLTVASELHDAIEYLPLDVKARLIFKFISGKVDVNTIPIYPDFAGLLKDFKEKRNFIAHAKTVVQIEQKNLDDAFLVLCILLTFAECKLDTFNAIRWKYYPKRNKDAGKLAKKKREEEDAARAQGQGNEQ